MIHINLVSVYRLAGGSLIDGHKHFVEAGGQIEHFWFFKGIVDEKAFLLVPQASGPKNSRAGMKQGQLHIPNLLPAGYQVCQEITKGGIRAAAQVLKFLRFRRK